MERVEADRVPGLGNRSAAVLKCVQRCIDQLLKKLWTRLDPPMRLDASGLWTLVSATDVRTVLAIRVSTIGGTPGY